MAPTESGSTRRPDYARVPKAKEDAYLRLRRRGASKRGAAREAGISPTAAYRIERELPQGITARGRASGTLSGRRAISQEDIPGPIPLADLTPEAARALEDFPYFRRRYFGRVTVPWQTDAIARMEAYRTSSHKEYAVVNVAPGVGKTTLFTHDYPAWLTVRDRRHRTMQGSRAKPLAARNVARVRRSLSRQSIAAPSDDDLRRGFAVMPTGILVEDFGRFAPEKRGDELWRSDGFVVMQYDEEVVTDKESTMDAFGFDTEFLGHRYPLIVWDDLVSKDNIRTPEARDKLAADYEEEAEARLEPGGLLILQGQRRASSDLYRHCLNQYVPVWWDEPEEELTRRIDRPTTATEVSSEDGAHGTGYQKATGHGQAQNPWLSDVVVPQNRDTTLLASPGDDVRGYRPKYHHVVYPAHFEDRCTGLHRMDDPAALDPERKGGCLLDPRRLPWRELLGHQAQNPTKYRILYQQEDGDPANSTVKMIWVTGGTDPETGEVFPGCLDEWRPAAQQNEPTSLPLDAPPSAHSVGCLDPSGSKFWAWQWWLYDADTQFQWLLNAVRRPMQAPEVIDWNIATGRFTGLFETEWQKSSSVGRPIRRIIVEVNVMQRWLLQYDAAQRWSRQRGVTFVPHTTGINKADIDKGPQTIGPHYRYGRVRLPAHPSLGKPVSDLLVHEATLHPEGMTDDQVMAHWFLVLNAPRLFPRRDAGPVFLRRPSWLRDDSDELHPLIQRMVRS